MQRHCSSLQRSARVRCDDALAFVEFRVEARKVIEKALVPGFKLPNVVTDQASPRDGIVIVVYPKMVASAYAMVRVLREEFNCNLPIELWYFENYIIDAYSAEPEFPKGQNCYGKREIGKNPHFATQGINNMSFAGLETTLRRFALEAAQVQKQEYKTHGGGK
ncbi:hypothetical protein BBO99_00004461 [Phytophthora kernoviae]|uniref:Uncharacterized protein n=2 Tax=Phytophthora kernoviae TaxID=325452 RepID=A0A3R7KK42_9STRA|nr:hypothetical protein G195_005778 [Phytophthora kernoviae 00238/432]KAG2524223.1 hypothetical protein JM16_005073 [Phytophthora kernoviae]KAG2525998.1 hypothetical protein JM18_004598 [Phytophthora kernoviae]RLN44677.1 hypothetical protein BBI17_005071 [Phytophthora kernoviae]RLN80496.1 hypothetical protein BBO99_00004461 [Phytophthora kernoviae]